MAPLLEGPPKTTRIIFFLVIQTTGVDVGKPVNITNSPADDGGPQFLADSGGVLFTSNRDGRPGALYRYDFAAKTTTPATEADQAAYAPPSRSVGAAASLDEESEEVIVPPTRSSLMARQSKVFLRKEDDDHWMEIASFKKAGVTGIRHVAVSPDGRWIAFAAGQVVK